MTDVETTGPWRKSRNSQSANQCVELAPLRGGGTGIRDSKQDGRGPVLVLTGCAWRQVLGAIRGGEFD